MWRAAQVFGAVLVIALGLSVVLFGTTAQAVQCGGLHALRIVDLDMAPDPAFSGQPIQRWTVKLQADGNGECATRIVVRDRNQLAGDAVAWTLRRGLNVIPVPVTAGYRMQGQDHCYTVLADIQNSQRPIDAEKPFCAKLRPISWTLK